MNMRFHIAPGMPIKCADGQDHGQIDNVDGDYLKLTNTDSGQAHGLPISVVDHLDEHVYLKLGHKQVLSENPQ